MSRLVAASRARRSWILLGGAIAAAVALAGCGDDTSARDQATAEIYTTVIRWMVADAGEASASAEDKVFVETAGDERIALAVQADVVGRLEDAMEVRFIDTREEAVETSEVADPVRDGGVLIGLGTLRDIERSSVHVYADRYRDLRDVVAYEIILERSGGRWQVTGDPARVEVRDADRVPG